MVKNLPASAGDIRNSSSIPGLGRSPEIGNGNPLLNSCLENLGRGAWQAVVHWTEEPGGLQPIGSQRDRHN